MRRDDMMLKVKLNIPASQDPDKVLLSLLHACVEQTGITLLTARGGGFDVEILDVERLASISEAM